jgi:hypothetical protein
MMLKVDNKNGKPSNNKLPKIPPNTNKQDKKPFRKSVKLRQKKNKAVSKAAGAAKKREEANDYAKEHITEELIGAINKRFEADLEDKEKGDQEKMIKILEPFVGLLRDK